MSNRVRCMQSKHFIGQVSGTRRGTEKGEQGRSSICSTRCHMVVKIYMTSGIIHHPHPTPWSPSRGLQDRRVRSGVCVAAPSPSKYPESGRGCLLRSDPTGSGRTEGRRKGESSGQLLTVHHRMRARRTKTRTEEIQDGRSRAGGSERSEEPQTETREK